MNIILSFALLLFTSTAIAKVNLANGHFFHQETDLSLKSKNSRFNLWRAYNSQSQNVGLFGRGWCSNIEYTLKANKKNGFDLYLCSKKRASFSSKKRNNKNFTSKQQKLAVNKNTIIFSSPGASTLHFNKQGQLKFIRPPGSVTFFRLRHRRQQIEITTPGNTLILRLHQQKAIHGVLDKKKVLIYKYAKNQLLNVKNASNQFIQYSYNAAKQLNSITDPKGNYLKIKYRPEKIVQQIDQNGFCLEKYKYVKSKKTQLKIAVERSCKDGFQHKNELIVDHYKNYKTKKIKDSFNNKIFILDKESELITHEKTSRGSTKYKYNSKNKITQIEQKSLKADYKAEISYNSAQQISSIRYTYPKKKNRSIKLKYTNEGKLKRLLSSQKNNFHIFYHAQRLKKVKTNTGQLTYHYDGKKNLTKVELKEKNKSYLHKLNKKNKTKDNIQITKFLNSVYAELGPLTTDSPLLEGVF